MAKTNNRKQPPVAQRQRKQFETLLSANARYEALLGSIADGVFALDNAGRIVHFNQAAADITSFSSKEVLGKDYRDVLRFFSAKTGESDNSFVVTAQGGKKTEMAGDTYVVAKNGRKVPVADSAAPIINRKGEIDGVIVVFRDVSHDLELRALKEHETKQIKRRAAQVLAEKTKTDALIQSIGDGLIFTNQYGDIIDVNTSAAELLGYDEHGILKRKISETAPLLTAAGKALLPLKQPTVQAIANGVSVAAEGFYRKKDGSLFPVSITVSPVVVKDAPIGAVVVFRDITLQRELQKLKERETREIKRRSAQILAEKTKSEALIESIGDGLIFTNQYGEISDVNASASTLLGYAEQDLLKSKFGEMVPFLTEDGKVVATMDRPMFKSLAMGIPMTAEGYYRRKDNTIFPVSITVSPVIVDDTPIGAVEVFRDITSQRELDKAKDEFVSLASHQLRTPATGIKAFLSMVLEGDVGKITPQQRDFISKAYSSNERELSLITDLLMVARADADRLEMRFEESDVRELVDGITAEHAEMVKSRKQKIEIIKPDKPVMAMLDRDKIKMVIDNFVSNASKYTPEGGSVKVKIIDQPKLVEVAVTDTGVGIDKPDIKKLFIKFSRIDNELSTKVGGTGLGLYLVKKIVDFHHGKLKVDSTLGKGSTFTVQLPKKQRGRQ